MEGNILHEWLGIFSLPGYWAEKKIILKSKIFTMICLKDTMY